MARKHLRCLLCRHQYVRAHAAGERPHGPNQQVCRRYGKRATIESQLFGTGGMSS